MKKSTRVIRTILTIIVTVAFVGAAFAKLTGNAMEVALFHSINIDNFRISIGIIELFVAAGLWWRKTRTLAVLLATAIMGAAIAETLSLGVYSQVLFPGIVLLLVWIIFKLHTCNCNCATCAKNQKAEKVS